MCIRDRYYSEKEKVKNWRWKFSTFCLRYLVTRIFQGFFFYIMRKPNLCWFQKYDLLILRHNLVEGIKTIIDFIEKSHSFSKNSVGSRRRSNFLLNRHSLLETNWVNQWRTPYTLWLIHPPIASVSIQTLNVSRKCYRQYTVL